MSGIGPGPLSDEQLHAYVDGHLDEAACAEVERILAESPESEARVAAWRRQRDMLKAALDPVADEPVPDRLRPQAIAGRRMDPVPVLRRAAVFLAIAALGAAGGWWSRDWFDADRLAAGNDLPAYALSAHRIYAAEKRHPVEVGADEEQHLVTWMSNRLGHPMRVPDLSDEGFRLVGGRLLPDGRAAAAQYMYEDESGLRLTLFATANNPTGETAFRTVSDGQLRAFYWRDGQLGYAIAGPLPRERLLRIARQIYRQLEDRS